MAAALRCVSLATRTGLNRSFYPLTISLSIAGLDTASIKSGCTMAKSASQLILMAKRELDRRHGRKHTYSAPISRTMPFAMPSSEAGWNCSSRITSSQAKKSFAMPMRTLLLLHHFVTFLRRCTSKHLENCRLKLTKATRQTPAYFEHFWPPSPMKRLLW
jgi:hypothetical protein